jgi:hypothetical protein
VIKELYKEFQVVKATITIIGCCKNGIAVNQIGAVEGQTPVEKVFFTRSTQIIFEKQ